MADSKTETELVSDGKWCLPSGSGSLAMESSRRQRLNVSVWQAWCDSTHLEETQRATQAHTQKRSRNGNDVQLIDTDLSMLPEHREESKAAEMSDRRYL